MRAVQHAQPGLAFGVAVGLGKIDIDHQAVAVLHHHVAGEAELGGRAAALGGKSGLGVGGREMSSVGALLALPIDLRDAPAATPAADSLPGLALPAEVWFRGGVGRSCSGVR